MRVAVVGAFGQAGPAIGAHLAGDPHYAVTYGDVAALLA